MKEPQTIWTLPPELDQPAPRRIQVERLSPWASWVVILIGILFMVPFLTPLLLEYLVSIRPLEKHGQILTGHVEQQWRAQYRNTTHCEVSYSFTTPDGALIHKDGSEDGSGPCRHPAGSTVKVAYLPGNRLSGSLVSRLTDTLRMLVVMGGFIVGVLAAIMIWLRANHAYRVRKEKRLVETGVAIAANITTTTIIKERYASVFRVQCAYSDHTGRQHTMHRDYGIPFLTDMQSDLMKTLHVGTTILYDPEKPSRALLYPARVVRCIRPEAPTGASGP